MTHRVDLDMDEMRGLSVKVDGKEVYTSDYDILGWSGCDEESVSIVEIKGGPITYRYLEKKSKNEVIRMYLAHLDAYARLYDRCERLEGDLSYQNSRAEYLSKELALLRRFLKGREKN